VLAAVSALALPVLGALPSACGSGEGTTGKRIALSVKASSPEATRPLANAVGWTVSLSKALVATGNLYYFDGATIFSAAPGAPARDRHASPLRDGAVDLLGVRRAFAHPGHYVPGTARGQLLVGSSIDLLADNSLGSGDGVSGITRSATFSFQSPAVGAFAGELGAHVAVLEGTATKGGESRTFRAEIDAADVANTRNLPVVEGCPFEEVDMEADGAVTLTVKVSLWFDQAEFDATPKGAAGERVLLAEADPARRALVRGMKAGQAYAFAYSPR